MKFISFTCTPTQLSKSSEHTVTLLSVSRIISGKYQCEASADAPLFHTETSTAKMLVVELPAHNPVLTVSNNNSKNGIAIGELLKATCVSSPSHPPVNFTWTINGNILPVSLTNIDHFGIRTEKIMLRIFPFCFSNRKKLKIEKNRKSKKKPQMFKIFHFRVYSQVKRKCFIKVKASIFSVHVCLFWTKKNKEEKQTFPLAIKLFCELLLLKHLLRCLFIYFVKSVCFYFSQAMLVCDQFKRSRWIQWYRTIIPMRMQKRHGQIWLFASKIICYYQTIERFWYVVKRTFSIYIVVLLRLNLK